MISSLPPQPLTVREFRKRRESGANTFAEVDPEMARWVYKCQAEKKNAERIAVVATVIISIIAILFITLLVIFLK